MSTNSLLGAVSFEPSSFFLEHHKRPNGNEFVKHEYPIHSELREMGTYEYTSEVLPLEELKTLEKLYGISSDSERTVRVLEFQNNEDAVPQSQLEQLTMDINNRDYAAHPEIRGRLDLDLKFYRNVFEPRYSPCPTAHPECFRLLVSFPHFNLGLEERGDGDCRASRLGPFTVHRTTFIVFNSNMIAMDTTDSTGAAGPSAFLPSCVFHLLVHMVSTIQRISARTPNTICRSFRDLGRRIQSFVPNPDSLFICDAGKQLSLEISELIVNASKILDLFELQVEVLQDLSEFLRNGKVMRPSTSADAVLEIAVKNGKNIIKKFQAFLDCGRESQRFLSQLQNQASIAIKLQEISDKIKTSENRRQYNVEGTLECNMEGTLECNIEVQLLQQIASRVQENTEVAKAALEFNREDVVLAKEERHLEDFRRHQESTMVATFTSVTITFLPIQVCVTVISSAGDGLFWGIGLPFTLPFLALTIYLTLFLKQRPDEERPAMLWVRRHFGWNREESKVDPERQGTPLENGSIGSA